MAARALLASARGRSRKAPVTITVRPIDGTDTQWRAHHSNIRLEEHSGEDGVGRTALAGAKWRPIAGFRVVVSWPENGVAPPPSTPVSLPARLAGLVGALLIVGGAVTLGVAVSAQQHAPQPSASAAGAIGPAANGPWLQRSMPVSVDIPAIGVDSQLLHLGKNPDGTMQVPSLQTSSDQAAWYEYSVTPGQIGTSVIEGHVDSYQGPAVFFRLGALQPGDTIDVTLADGITAIFRVTGVREYPKSNYPAKIIYGATDYAALRLITCGGVFDYATGHYLSSTVVFASLISSQPTAA
jgi:Sortase domain